MRPHRAGRHHLRPAYGCDLARRATPGGGLLRGDGLAPSTGLDRSRRLAPPARCDPHRAADGQAAGDGRLCHRRIAHPRPQRRSSHRTISSRPGPPRQQAPRHRRPARHTARCVTDRRQPTRCHPAHAARRCHPPHSWTARTAAPSPAMPVRRPRLRLRQVPATPPAPRDSSENRPPWCPPRLRLGQNPLGCRAHLRLAPPVQEAPHPLRDTRRLPPRPATTRLQHHLLEATPNLILKRSVSLVGLQPHLLETPEEVRIMNLHCSSRSYGSRSSWRMTRDPGPKPADAVS